VTIHHAPTSCDFFARLASRLTKLPAHLSNRHHTMADYNKTMHDAFKVVADTQSRMLCRTVCVVGAIMTVALAPYDLVLASHDVRAAATIGWMRAALIAIYVMFFVLLRLQERQRIDVRFLQVPALLATVAFGAAVGRLAQENNYWLFTLYMAPVMCGVVLVPLVERMVFAVLFTFMPLMGFAMSFEGRLSEQHLVHALGLFFMAAAFGVFAGNSFYKLFRDAFELRRALDEKRAELTRANTTLEARVEEQTDHLRQLAMGLDDVLETERRRMARELHDDLGQELTAMRFEVEALRFTVRDEGLIARVGRIAAAIERSHQSVRLILESLRPRILDEEGIEAAVRWLARQFRERTSLTCETTITLGEEPDSHVGLAAFRMVQECLTNVARHAAATKVSVLVRGDTHEITVRVIDNGRGRPTEGASLRHGLVGMRERAIAVGGTLEITAAEPTGTLVQAVFPTRRRLSVLTGVVQ
jgi:signal transduction histidine kinase